MKSHEENMPVEPVAVTIAKFLTNGFLPEAVTVEAVDRLRWDHLCFTGHWEGAYEKHTSPSDLKDRAPAVAGIRRSLDKVPGPVRGVEGFGDGKTYAELLLPVIASMIADKYAPRTRAASQPGKPSASEGY